MWSEGKKQSVVKGATVAALIWALAGMALADTPGTLGMEGEEAFLDVLPKVTVPAEVQPIPGAVNEEFRNCRSSWPAEYLISQKGPEARAYRDIYGFVKVRNVINSRDCSCSGKVARWEIVEEIAEKLRKEHNTETLGWQQTVEIFSASNELFPIAEVMCGGRF